MSDRPELSRPFAVAKIPKDGETFHFEAAAEERSALARRFGLVDLLSLEAEGEIVAFDHGRRARLEGIMRAQVVQACVVTLGPVRAVVEDSFVRTYASVPPRPPGSEPEIILDLDVEDPPEPILGGVVDVGEAVAETLGLALDPYPRAPGAELGEAAAGGGEAPQNVTEPPENKRESPFGILKGLVKKP